MKMVVGLGNPGQRYRNTRHNIGFRVVGELARRHASGKPSVKFDAEIVEIVLAEETVLLVSPLTFMNASGRCVGQLVKYYRLALPDLLVVCDDMNLDVGRLRLRPGGSCGGQKGLRDIIDRLGTEEFSRLRIGIGRPPGQRDASDYVLSRFRREEGEVSEQAVVTAADGVEIWIRDGLEAAMNRVNVSLEKD